MECFSALKEKSPSICGNWIDMENIMPDTEKQILYHLMYEI